MASYAKKTKKCEPAGYDNEELRILLVGKDKSENNATGNTILGKNSFKASFSASSSMDVMVNMGRGEVDGQKVTVVSFTLDPHCTELELSIVQCLSFASPGPHVFLIVIRLGRFTKEEKQMVQKIQEIFGEEADKYSMVLFTHGDLLDGEPIEGFLAESEELQELVAKCNGQYHVFDNEVKDHSQVRELLNKIRNITEKNGGNHFTNEKFQAAGRAIERDTQLILKEIEKQKRREQEEMEKKLQKK